MLANSLLLTLPLMTIKWKQYHKASNGDIMDDIYRLFEILAKGSPPYLLPYRYQRASNSLHRISKLLTRNGILDGDKP